MKNEGIKKLHLITGQGFSRINKTDNQKRLLQIVSHRRFFFKQGNIPNVCLPLSATILILLFCALSNIAMPLVSTEISNHNYVFPRLPCQKWNNSSTAYWYLDTFLMQIYMLTVNSITLGADMPKIIVRSETENSATTSESDTKIQQAA